MADQFCYICGDVGYAELMVTCTNCKVVREHLYAGEYYDPTLVEFQFEDIPRRNILVVYLLNGDYVRCLLVVYCMRNKSHDVPKSWLCGNCTLDEAKSPDDSGLQVQPKMLRHTKTGKVKFLPTEEVVKLSSGVMNVPSKLNTAIALQRASKSRKFFESSMPRPLFQASKESQERCSAMMPPKICGVKKQASATCLPPMPVGPAQTFKKVKVTDAPACTSSVSRHGLPVTNTGKEVPSPSTKLEDVQKQRKDASWTHGVHAYCDNTGKEFPSPSTKLKDTQKLRKDASFRHEMQAYRDNTGKEVPSPSTKSEDTQKQRKDAPCTPELLAYRDNTGNEVPSPSTKLEGTQKQREGALMIQEIRTYRDYLPSLHASWKGGFEFVDARMAGEFYDGFLAKPPCVVCGRVYELSRKIPPILQVKLHSRSDIWDDLFHNECPDLADVALYFFPGNIERSRKNNSCLFELMEREDLLIRSLIDGAELVLFTCRQLDLLSQYVVNMLNAEYLLFGVFRDIEDDQSPFPMLEYGSAVSAVECDSRAPPVEFTPNGHGKHDEDNAVKREIDIKGGNTAGKSQTANDVDSTIQRLLLEFGSQKPKESDVNALNMNAQIKAQEPAPIAATGSFSFSLSKVKTEPSPVIKAEGSEGKKCLEPEHHRSRMVPTFSIDGSQNKSGLTGQDVPKRVAEKYLQIFNAGIKKERRYF